MGHVLDITRLPVPCASRHATVQTERGSPVKGPRFWVVVVLITAAVILLRTRSDADVNPASEPLRDVPKAIAGWSGTDFDIDQQTLEVLGSGEFLSRIYTRQESPKTGISLFLAYFPTQRSGVTIHSPKNCLPGSGWVFESSNHERMTGRDGKSYNIGEYIISNAGRKQIVLYWYQSHGRSIASEYLAKVYLVADAIRMQRTDAALVRVITPIDADEDMSAARNRVMEFAAELAPQLHRFIPD
jgi:EpsI family protein